MAVDRFRVQVNGTWYDVGLEAQEGRVKATCGGKTWDVDLREYSDTNLVSLLLDHRSFELLIDRHGDTYTILRDTEQYRAQVKPAWASISRRGDESAQAGELTIESPLVGLVVDVRVAAGQQVERGDVLLVIEAMKMQNELRAPRAGAVKAIRVRAGQKVSARQQLVSLS